ncbi:hypothetical protein [uncultured Flavobacterium sp.]|uniref:hypothetical protein n=1 Tax=uncultured Flavobacterium sp. TaxID=165435 RepID=UPI0025CDDE44|nr:hypothetical protein [uncultured Flavobacterium sp.]
MDTRYRKNELMEWLSKLEEPEVWYQISKLKEESEKESDFNFDKEFENGYTLEEAKAESINKIREWWGK